MSRRVESEAVRATMKMNVKGKRRSGRRKKITWLGAKDKEKEEECIWKNDKIDVDFDHPNRL